MMDPELQKIWDDPELLKQWTLAEYYRRDIEACEGRDDLAIFSCPGEEETRHNQVMSAARAGDFEPMREHCLDMAMRSARDGDLKHLRQLYPELAEFFCVPPQRKHAWRKHFAEWPLVEADRMARDIRKLWKEVFGQCNRHDELHLEIATGGDPTKLKNYRSNKTRKKNFQRRNHAR